MAPMIETFLAADRITRLLHEDVILDRPRTAVQRWAVKNGHPSIHYLTTCPYCISMYAAVIAVLLPRRLRRVAAVAGAVVIAYEVRERLDK